MENPEQMDDPGGTMETRMETYHPSMIRLMALGSRPGPGLMELSKHLVTNSVGKNSWLHDFYEFR